MPRPASAVVTSKPARFVLALLRIAVGFIFLWSFLDKTFGLHYSTGPSRAWINGGTPAQSYLTGATTGKPLASFFESLAMPAMDWLFMLGLLGIGLAFLLGSARASRLSRVSSCWASCMRRSPRGCGVPSIRSSTSTWSTLSFSS